MQRSEVGTADVSAQWDLEDGRVICDEGRIHDNCGLTDCDQAIKATSSRT